MQLTIAGCNFIKDVFTELSQLFWAGMHKKTQVIAQSFLRQLKNTFAELTSLSQRAGTASFFCAKGLNSYYRAAQILTCK